MVAAGPAGPRRRLGAELRRLRTGKGLHLDEVAGQLRCSTSKISRLETGKGVPKAADVRALIRVYDVTGDAEREMLLRLVRESRTEGWWESYTDGVHRSGSSSTSRRGTRRWRPRRRRSARSTSRHCTACCRSPATRVHSWGAAAAPLVDADRAARRAAWPTAGGAHPRRAPLELTVVVDESVLCRRVGDATVMRTDAALLEFTELPASGPGASVRGGRPPGPQRRLQDPRVRCRRVPMSSTSRGGDGEYLEGESDVDLYRDVFDDAPPARSTRMLRVR